MVYKLQSRSFMMPRQRLLVTPLHRGAVFCVGSNIAMVRPSIITIATDLLHHVPSWEFLRVSIRPGQ